MPTVPPNASECLKRAVEADLALLDRPELPRYVHTRSGQPRVHHISFTNHSSRIQIPLLCHASLLLLESSPPAPLSLMTAIQGFLPPLPGLSSFTNLFHRKAAGRTLEARRATLHAAFASATSATANCLPAWKCFLQASLVFLTLPGVAAFVRKRNATLEENGNQTSRTFPPFPCKSEYDILTSVGSTQSEVAPGVPISKRCQKYGFSGEMCLRHPAELLPQDSGSRIPQST